MTINDYIISEEMSLMETMKVIDKNASGNAFICRDGALVAAVSDGDKTITEHIIERFQKFGCLDFYMIVNYKKNFIKSYFTDSFKQEEQNRPVQIHFAEEESFLGTGG